MLCYKICGNDFTNWKWESLLSTVQGHEDTNKLTSGTATVVVAGHQPFHPFHFGPRPFHFGSPLDPGQRVPDPLVGTLPFKLTGKYCTKRKVPIYKFWSRAGFVLRERRWCQANWTLRHVATVWRVIRFRVGKKTSGYAGWHVPLSVSDSGHFLCHFLDVG
jgi:hypothetical protein